VAWTIGSSRQAEAARQNFRQRNSHYGTVCQIIGPIQEMACISVLGVGWRVLGLHKSSQKNSSTEGRVSPIPAAGMGG